MPATLMTDVWTTAGVILGVAAASLTGWLWLDPLIACLVAFNILREGGSLVQRAIHGLLDQALSPDEAGAVAAFKPPPPLQAASAPA